MKFRKINQLFTSKGGRFISAAMGLGLVFLILNRVGWNIILISVNKSVNYFPLILLLEAAILICSMSALRLLYGNDRHNLPLSALVRAGLIGYAVMGLVPAGRTLAESTRAMILSRYSTGPGAAAAAAKLQGIALLAIAAISIPATCATYFALGPSWPSALIAGNILLTSALGFGILLAAQTSRIGSRIGKLIPSFNNFGQQLDEHFTGNKLIPFGPLVFELLGRVLQVVQNYLLVAAVGGKLGVVPALCSEAFHLVGASAGDLIPAQLGATEFSYQYSGSALALQPAEAVSIALIAHLAQLIWVIIGLLVPVIWPNTVRTNASPFLTEAKL